MTSELIYDDIKFHQAKKSYNYLKNRYLLLIKNKYTLNKNLAEAEDRFSSSFIKLYEKIKNDEVKNISNLGAYFLVICKNSFLLEFKKEIPCVSHDLNHLPLEGNAVKTELKNPIDIIKLLLNKLPDKLKKVNEMIYLDDMDHKEIAKALNMNYENVRKYHYKAIRFLKSVTPIHYRDYIPTT